MTDDITQDEIVYHSWPPRQVGGQHVGTPRAGVLVVHRPTGIGAMCMDERSQLRNRERATAMMHALLDLDKPLTISAAELTPEALAQLKAFQEMPRLQILHDAHANPDHDSLFTKFEQLEGLLGDLEIAARTPRDCERLDAVCALVELIRAQVLK